MASIYCGTSTTRKLCWSKCALSPIEMCVTRAVQGEINSPKISALRKMGFWLGYSCVSFKQMRECCQTPWHRYPLLMCSAGWIFPPSIVASHIPYKPPRPLSSGLLGDFMEAAAASARKKRSTQIMDNIKNCEAQAVHELFAGPFFLPLVWHHLNLQFLYLERLRPSHTDLSIHFFAWNRRLTTSKYCNC